jgi:hypothetical protein
MQERVFPVWVGVGVDGCGRVCVCGVGGVFVRRTFFQSNLRNKLVRFPEMRQS